MKIYFDTLDIDTSNLNHLSRNGDISHWIVSPGSIIMRRLGEINCKFGSIDNVTDSGCYFIDVAGDPVWWAGVLKQPQLPNHHILTLIPDHILELVRQRKIRIIISGDKEGGPMVNDEYDCFESTTQAMISKQIPAQSVLILQGNKKIQQQYESWLAETKSLRLFEVQYSCSFAMIFYNRSLLKEPVIHESIKSATYAFNSLNRVYRSHRGAHCYYLVKNNLLNNGIVSCNQISLTDDTGAALVEMDRLGFTEILQSNFPKFVDGDWSNINAADQYNIDVYKNSLMSFVTETKFDEDVIFLTEKVFKPLVLGHPLILLASPGTLSSLKDLGFKIDWCGIDPSYNDIEDDKQRFIKTHEILKWWIHLPREEKIEKIQQSIDTIRHNFDLVRSKNFYHEALRTALNSSEEYFDA
jgi:hypothetical protein